MGGKFVLEIKQSPVLNTKFGTATIGKNGYYIITSRKEGNYKKYLHRLIFEDNFGPLNSDVAHHKNQCKTDNCIYNFQRMGRIEHDSWHNMGENNPFYGKHHSAESRAKIGAAIIGENNPQSEYHNLWDNSKVDFRKEKMFRKTGGVGKAFYLKYNGKYVKCGGFIDPVSCEIINNIIKNEEEGGEL